MGTYFFNRTLLSELGIPVPKYFLELDNFHTSISTKLRSEYSGYYSKHTENIARRYADILFYEKLINHEYYNVENSFLASLKIGSLLIGFYSSLKSFVDSISTTLNDMLNLNLDPMNRDLCRSKIWEVLPNHIKDNYEPFRVYFEDIKNYRNSASHRITPLVMVCGPTSAREDKSPSEINRRNIEIRLVDELDYDINSMNDRSKEINWTNPIHHIDGWNSNLDKLAKLISTDIKNILLEIGLNT